MNNKQTITLEAVLVRADERPVTLLDMTLSASVARQKYLAAWDLAIAWEKKRSEVRYRLRHARMGRSRRRANGQYIGGWKWAKAPAPIPAPRSGGCGCGGVWY